MPKFSSLRSAEPTLAARAARSAAALRARLERRVVGQGPLKDALVLSLVSKEHLYVEGPPGIGKTALAEAACAASGRRSFFAQLHRDTRLSELIGDAVIRREVSDDGEVIRSDVRAGALLTAEVAVLDDISRAPGEALNVLLRLLNERKYHERPIPLWSAVATGNPTSADFYNEPLDPATLDRFALQIRTEGLVGGGAWEAASSVVDQFGDSPYCTWAPPSAGGKSVDKAAGAGEGGAACEGADAIVDLDCMYEALQHVPLSEAVRDALLAFLERLRSRHGLDATNSLLTDRTFLTKAPKLIRAAAVIAGREVAHPDDLRVLRLLTAFRVPDDVHSGAVDDLIEEVANEARERLRKEFDRGAPGSGGGGSGSGGGGDGKGGKGGGDAGGDGSGSPQATPQEGTKASTPETKSSGHRKQAAQTEAPPKPGDPKPGEGGLQRAQANAAVDDPSDPANGPSQAPSLLLRLLRMLVPTERKPPVETNVDAASVRGLLTLIGVLKGEFERHVHVTRVTHTDGVPRGWRRLRGFDSFAEDADPVDAACWMRHTPAVLPDAVRRAKPNRGGALAICRDVSTSMHGINAKYASSLALRVIELAQRRRMRVAMLEYSDEVHAHRCAGNLHGGGFFTTDYSSLRTFARRLECGGLTDYEAPISQALDEFKSDRRLRSPYVSKHILFITDGHPTKGDRRCVEARRRMKRAGVQLHTLFVEPEPHAAYPPLLAALADDSKGVRMRATVLDADAGVIDVEVVSSSSDARTRERFGGGGALADVRELDTYPHLRRIFAR